MRKFAFKGFLSSSSGNVGLMLALAAMPLVGGAGVAVDYARKIEVEARVQASIDSGALAGAAKIGRAHV